MIKENAKLKIFAKISTKLTLIYALVFSIVLICLNASILYTSRFFLLHNASKQIENINKNLIPKLQNVNDSEFININERKMLESNILNSDIFIRVLNKSNSIIFQSKISRKIPIQLHTTSNKGEKLGLGENKYFYSQCNVITSKHKIIYLQVIKGLDPEYDFLQLLFVLMLISDGIGIIVSIIAGLFVSKKMLKPIDEMTRLAKSISAEDLGRRLDTSGPDDEFKRFGETFNEMIGRLETSFVKQSQFITDASHELGTPMSVIDGYINLLDRWGKEDKEILNEAIKAIKAETKNMKNMTQKLLFLAIGDTNVQTLEFEKFYLNELIDEIVCETKIIDTKHMIINEQNEKILINCDRKMIKQMIRALVNNSIKYTSELGTINIQSIMDKDNVRIIIEDTGIGIPEQDIPFLFDRFYRVDKARTKEKGGNGLGLSVVKWIVDAHNGKIQIESSVGIGTKITVILPSIENQLF